jgi:hypothetical protein
LRNYSLGNKILRHKRIFGAAAPKAMVTYNAQNTVRES